MIRSLPLLVLLSVAGIASAGVPDPRFSTFPPCWTLCPNGDLSFTATIRDVSNAPLPGVLVDVDLCSCPSVHLCPPTPVDGYTVNGCHVTAVTNAAGQVTFALRGGGGCGGLVPLHASGVLLGYMTRIASPDQDASLAVDAADLALLVTKHGGSDVTGDLDCSGGVDVSDDAVLSTHLGHACANQTPARSASWGHVRSLYR